MKQSLCAVTCRHSEEVVGSVRCSPWKFLVGSDEGRIHNSGYRDRCGIFTPRPYNAGDGLLCPCFTSPWHIVYWMPRGTTSKPTVAQHWCSQLAVDSKTFDGFVVGSRIFVQYLPWIIVVALVRVSNSCRSTNLCFSLCVRQIHW